MFEIKVLLRHSSALIPRTADNKGSSIRSFYLDDLIVNIDLDYFDDLDEGGGVDDLALFPMFKDMEKSFNEGPEKNKKSYI